MRRGGVWGRGQSDACDRRPAPTDPVPGTEQMVPGTGWRDGAGIWCQALSMGCQALSMDACQMAHLADPCTLHEAIQHTVCDWQLWNGKKPCRFSHKTFSRFCKRFRSLAKPNIQRSSITPHRKTRTLVQALL
jgi:hypothetical protein